MSVLPTGHFYHAVLCSRGVCYGPVSILSSVTRVQLVKFLVLGSDSEVENEDAEGAGSEAPK